MIIECTNCHSKYHYDEQRFEQKVSKKIKCARCQHIFEIFKPSAARVDGSAAPPPVQREEKGDQTGIRRAPKTVVDEPLPDMSRPEPAPTPKAPLQLPPGKRLSLAIIDGPGAGNVFRLEKPRVTIGRQGADLNLNDTDASRQHAALEVREGSYRLVDLQSTNGTLVDGQKINGSVELQNHAEFQIGSSTLMLIVTEES